jgi:hypothetical protein
MSREKKLESKTGHAFSQKNSCKLAPKPRKSHVLSIYLAAFYGNKEEGPDGDDTVYLVRARSHRRAGELIEHSRYDKDRVPEWVCMVATDNSGSNIEEILAGPFLGMASARTNLQTWTRRWEDGKWKKYVPRILEGMGLKDE